MAVSFGVNHQGIFWQAAGQPGTKMPNDPLQRKRFRVGGFDSGQMTLKLPEIHQTAGLADKVPPSAVLNPSVGASA